jgi:uncharacterized repeat protein (TIGR03803 family)
MPATAELLYSGLGDTSMRVFSAILFAIALTGGTSLASANHSNGGASGMNAARGSESSLARRPNGNHGYKLLYTFQGGSADGEYPSTGLTAVNGALYGTTVEGGSAGAGTVFAVSASGTESVLYNFAGSPDAGYPAANLSDVNGALYGTTAGGGGGTCGSGGVGCGAIFEVSTAGAESVLSTFNGPDGSTPLAALVSLHGKLYGTTESGGAEGAGSIFELSKSGKVRVLYSFTGGTDGGNPFAGLIVLNGTLYGTTFEGGTPGFGTVFTVSTSGQERVVYNFLSNGQDGENPQAGLVALNGKLYGTTVNGGRNGYGSVFEVSTSGKERVLTGDVDEPEASLIAVNGALYGTTTAGGVGDGTVFKITTSGKEDVLYNFKGGTDGRFPDGSLLDVNGALYGTTYAGGAPGFGTIFTIAP